MDDPTKPPRVPRVGLSSARQDAVTDPPPPIPKPPLPFRRPEGNGATAKQLDPSIDPAEFFAPSPGRGGTAHPLSLRLDDHLFRMLQSIVESSRFGWSNTSDAVRYMVIDGIKRIAERMQDPGVQSAIRDYDIIRAVVARQKLAKAASDIYSDASELLRTLEVEQPVAVKTYAGFLLKKLLATTPEVQERYRVLIDRCQRIVSGV